MADTGGFRKAGVVARELRCSKAAAEDEAIKGGTGFEYQKPPSASIVCIANKGAVLDGTVSDSNYCKRFIVTYKHMATVTRIEDHKGAARAGSVILYTRNGRIRIQLVTHASR